MALEKLTLKNFTVFGDADMEFSDGINVLIGENGKGKTHIMKVLYSAVCAADKRISFPQKIVRCFSPDEHRIARLVSRKRGNSETTLRIVGKTPARAERKVLTAKFSKKTKGWEAAVTGKSAWETAFEASKGTFIPAKEILSHSYNLHAAVEKNNVSFDDTYLDVVNSAKVDISVGKNPVAKQTLLSQIEKIIEGKVHFDAQRDEFYLKQGGAKMEFNLVAEGIRKIALIWQLAKNGTLVDGSVLFWDEPEANINPVHLPVIASLLLSLQRSGVQVFVATHHYIFAKYLEILKEKEDAVAFLSLYEGDSGVECERRDTFSALEHNPIMSSFETLLDAVYTAEVN